MSEASTVELDANVMAAAPRVATKRGVAVAVVVNDAVKGFVAGSDLRELLRGWRDQDAARRAVIDDESAMQIANEEIAAFRRARDEQGEVARRVPRT